MKPRKMHLFVLLLFAVTVLRAQSVMYVHIENVPKGTMIVLEDPMGISMSLLNDSINRDRTIYQLQQIGKYKISVQINSVEYGNDEMSLPFVVTGKENRVEANLSFRKEKTNRSDWKCRDSLLGCNVCVKCFYKAPSEVSVKYVGAESGDYYEGQTPLFNIHNGSRDTLYGYWMDGYFWGTLKLLIGDTTIDIPSNIDLNFVYRPPLYPDSTTFATVGSFGRPIPRGDYRFNVLYATKRQSRGLRQAKENDKLRWRTIVQQWYELSCDFSF